MNLIAILGIIYISLHNRIGLSRLSVVTVAAPCLVLHTSRTRERGKVWSRVAY